MRQPVTIGSMAATARHAVISVDPEVMSGVPVFRDSRVPIQTLFDYLAAGDPLEEFLEDFPPITREMCLQVIEEAGHGLVERYGTHPS